MSARACVCLLMAAHACTQFETAIQSVEPAVAVPFYDAADEQRSDYPHCPGPPGPPGRLSALSVFHSKSCLYGAFVWARRALNSQKRRFSARAATWTETFDVPRALLGGGGGGGSSPRRIGAARAGDAVGAAAASSYHESPSCLANIGASGGECEGEGDGESSATVAVETVGRWTYVPITLGSQPRQVEPGQWDSVYKGFAVPLMLVDPTEAE
jgi:hypothetical protein